MHATTIAVDLAKSAFQVPIANQAQGMTERKRLTMPLFKRFLAQQPLTRVVLEACATAHYWAQFARNDPVIIRLMRVSGVGDTTATALVANVTDIHLCKRRGNSPPDWM